MGMGLWGGAGSEVGRYPIGMGPGGGPKGVVGSVTGTTENI